MEVMKTPDRGGLSLNDGWVVTRENGDEQLTVDFPSDIHSALLKEGLIEDPYWRDREASLDWVHESTWVAERTFELSKLSKGPRILSLENVDCQAVVSLNGVELATLCNRFRRHDLDVTDTLRPAENRLQIRFLSNSATAREKADAFPFPVPHIAWNNRIPHYNFLRKPQCDAGWDWNIALSPLGVYGDIWLRETNPTLLSDVTVQQRHELGRVSVTAVLHITCNAPSTTFARMKIGEQREEREVTLFPGTHDITLEIEIADPQLWWPVGHGTQTMYDLEVELGGSVLTRRIGLREITLVTDTDEIGAKFGFRVNGRDIFMRGANWIPADALPGRATPEAVADLLDSAVMANMNMLRIWGGGTYEPDWFYEMCSERGILIWQDFMFACNLYPSSDRAWLDEVRTEARQNVRRLSAHPCMALWCGDNELVGAIGWFDESRNDRDRYLAMYARLNSALEEIVEDAATDIPWWPSSPCAGHLNYGDSWHDDTSGDMHFWDVWHEAKDFEHYRNVRPRFCSEFGFQSFPSPALIRTFTEEGDRNVSSKVMDVHQRNDGGNSRIVETLTRYFRFPDSFDEMCWLSQVSQGLAMKTAIEFWRSSKPRTMGTLYWQLNDTWPVASWSSLEYGGNWKLTQYLARRFYDPVLVTAQPDHERGEIVILAVNDTPETVSLDVVAMQVDVAGPMAEVADWAVVCPPEGAVEIARVDADRLADQELLSLVWRDAERQFEGENEYWPNRPKAYALETPQITHRETNEGIIFETDKPAFFVTYDFGGHRVWSDNCFTLLPDRPKLLKLEKERQGINGDASLYWLKG